MTPRPSTQVVNVATGSVPEASPGKATGAVVELAGDLIRLESVTPNDGGCQAVLAERLKQMDFQCEEMPFGDVKNLWAVREGRTRRPLLVFAGHTDVVPSGPPGIWSFPPFCGTVEDGELCGRGAADMKGGIAAFVVACERFVAKNPDHEGSIGLLLTSDEEGAAIDGTRRVVEELSARGDVDIDACLVGEPTSSERCGDIIKVGRRGSLGGTLTIRGRQGHVAYPHLADNPLHSSLGALKSLVETEWDRGNANFPPTTFQISNINGGTGATNVIPGHKTVHFNFRYSPETSDVELKRRVESILDENELTYDIEWEQTDFPYETKRGTFTDSILASIRDVTGLNAKTSTSGGTSDGRFVAATGAQVVELGLLNATIHQVDERVLTSDLETLSAIYEDVIKRVLCQSR